MGGSENPGRSAVAQAATGHRSVKTIPVTSTIRLVSETDPSIATEPKRSFLKRSVGECDFENMMGVVDLGLKL